MWWLLLILAASAKAYLVLWVLCCGLEALLSVGKSNPEIPYGSVMNFRKRNFPSKEHPLPSSRLCIGIALAIGLAGVSIVCWLGQAANRLN